MQPQASKSHAVLYAAKSTEDKHGSIPDQLADCRAMAERENWTVVGEFTDESASAYHGNRGPGLEQAKEAATAAAAKHDECMLVAQHSDRISRGAGDKPGAADHLVEVVAWANRHNVRLRTVQDDNYTDGNLAYVLAAVGGMRNTEDSRRKSLAVKGGMQRRAKRGLPKGGQRPYGYKYADGTLKQVPAEAKIVRRIFREFIVVARRNAG